MNKMRHETRVKRIKRQLCLFLALITLLCMNSWVAFAEEEIAAPVEMVEEAVEEINDEIIEEIIEEALEEAIEEAIEEPIDERGVNDVQADSVDGIQSVDGNISPFALEVVDANSCIVYTPADLKSALQNATYTTIYFGDNIALDERVTVAQRQSLTISGMNPNDPNQTVPYTYTDNYGNRSGADLYYVAMHMSDAGRTPNITFKQINLIGYNIYGVITTPTYITCKINILFDEVTGTHYQFLALNDSTLTIRNSTLAVDKIGTYLYSEEVAEVKNLIFEGDVIINHRSTVGNPYSVFNFFNYGSSTATITIREGANLTINKLGSKDYYGCFHLYTPTNYFTAGKNSTFTFNGVDRFMRKNTDLYVFTDFTVEEGAEVSLKWNTAGLDGEPRGIFTQSLTVKEGASLSVVGPVTSYAAIQAKNINLYSPKYFLASNTGSSTAISSSTDYQATLSATGLSSIRYYSTIANFNAGIAARAFYQDSGAFNLSVTNWGRPSPGSPVTSYIAGAGATAMTSATITTNTMKTVEIGGTLYTLQYDGNGATSGTEPATSYHTYNERATVASVGDMGKEYCVFTGWNTSPDGSGKSYSAGATINITENVVLYAQWLQGIHIVTENYVNAAGEYIKGDTIVEFDALTPYDYLFAGSLDDIEHENGKYVYLGYKIGSYSEGDELNPDRPELSDLTESINVYLVYRLWYRPGANPPIIEYEPPPITSATVTGTYELYGLTLDTAYLERSVDGVSFASIGGTVYDGYVTLDEADLTPNTRYWYRTCIVVDGEIYTSEVSSFVTRPTISAVNVTVVGEWMEIEADFIEGLNGQNPTAVEIFYSTSSSMPEEPQVNVGSGEAFRAGFDGVQITGLTQGELYYIWVRETNESGEHVYGPVSVYMNYLITEKYVDQNGDPIQADTSRIVLASDPVYGFTDYPQRLETESGAYAYAGYRIGGGDTLLEGTPSILAVVSSQTVYLVYSEIEEVNVKVSKKVSGSFANKTTAFSFKVFFQDSNGDPLPEGTVFDCIITGEDIETPISDRLTLIFGGEAEFRLKHGQSIVIYGVAADGYICVVETIDDDYYPSFVDSYDATNTPIHRNDTTMLPMAADDRAFSFTNERLEVPPTGIEGMAAAPTFTATGLMAGTMYALRLLLRRRKRG